MSAKSTKPAAKQLFPMKKYLYVCPGCNYRVWEKNWYFSKDRWCPKCRVMFYPIEIEDKE